MYTNIHTARRNKKFCHVGSELDRPDAYQHIKFYFAYYVVFYCGSLYATTKFFSSS